MLLRKLVAFAITTGLAKKAWDHYRRDPRKLPLVDITDVVARPVTTADPSQRRAVRMGARRRRAGPSA